MNRAMNRRRFAQLLGAGAAYVAAAPHLSLAPLAAGSPLSAKSADSVIRLNSNENPYGPSPKALKAMTKAFGLA